MCMHKRMEDILHEAEAITDIMAPGVNPGLIQGQPLTALAWLHTSMLHTHSTYISR